MNHTFPYAARAAALSLLLATAGAAAVTEDFSKTVPLRPGGVFSVSNTNGSVTVSAWDRNEVEIKAVKSARDQRSMSEVKIEVESSADGVAITTKLPSGWSKSGSVSYTIRAPRGADWRVSTVNGRLKLEGPGGALKAKSVNGAVEVVDAAGTVAAETVNGSLTASYGRLAGEGAHRFKSVNGKIRVYLPSDPAGSFRAKSVNGSINTDFPLRVDKARFGPNKSLEGQLGQGGGSFEFETVNGSIGLHRAGTAESSVRYRLP